MERGKSLHAAVRNARRLIHSPLVQDRDDEIGVLLDDGGRIPDEAFGRHCKTCGEDIEVAVRLSIQPLPGSVQEYRHSATRLVHCASAHDSRGMVIGLAEETAEPCWREGCASNAEIAGQAAAVEMRAHRHEPHAHAHIGLMGEHAHAHRHEDGGEEHSHMHAHEGT